jgi:hypothetical protein
VDGSRFSGENRSVSEHSKDLQRAVAMACNCKARQSSSTPVKETFRGEVVWEGVVETDSPYKALQTAITASRR